VAMPRSVLGFLGRVTVVHFVTYFVFGVIFAFFNPFHPGEHVLYAIPEFEAFFRPITDPLVRAGGLFQLVRGPILALALFPFRSIFLQNKRGWLLLWGLFLALAIIAPSGAAPSSIEGFVYTRLPAWFHLAGAPEVILQTLVFSVLVFVWERRVEKKITIPLIAAFIIMFILLLLGLLVTVSP